VDNLNSSKVENILRKNILKTIPSIDPDNDAQSSQLTGNAEIVGPIIQDNLSISDCSLVGDRAVVFSLNNQVGGLVRALRIFQVNETIALKPLLSITRIHF
jgi:hypothetical protein